MAALITFNAADIHLEGIEVDVELTQQWMGRALEDTEVQPPTEGTRSGRLHGRLSRSGNDIVVRAHVKVSVEVPCVRCLEPAAIEVDSELSLLLQPKPNEPKRGRRAGKPKGGKRQRAEEYEFESSEADLDTYDGENVVLDPFVRELILLEVPTFPLCRESCPGIQRPGAEPEPDQRPLDPRLAPLGAFRETEGPATIDDLIAAANERARALGRKPILRSNHTKKKKKKK
jgi:uncharacterized protein